MGGSPPCPQMAVLRVDTPVMGCAAAMRDTAVLVIDMLNPYRHQDAERLAPNVANIIDPLALLISRSRDRKDVDLTYVNDNYGDFTADFNDIARSALSGERPDLAKPIAPDEDCQRVVKVRHSAFDSTPLHYLLDRRGVQRVILTGQVTEQTSRWAASVAAEPLRGTDLPRRVPPLAPAGHSPSPGAVKPRRSKRIVTKGQDEADAARDSGGCPSLRGI